MLGGFYHGGQVIGGIDAFATDKTPVGTVISVGCAKTGEVTGKTTPTGAFPTKDYLVCDNATYNITDYPKLANYLEEAYGSKNYFGGNGTTTFAVPNWQASFPVNGVLCIKAQISSNQISLAEIDDDTPNPNMVYSSAKVEDIANDLDSRVGTLEDRNDIIQYNITTSYAYDSNQRFRFWKKNGIVYLQGPTLSNTTPVRQFVTLSTISDNRFKPFTENYFNMIDNNNGIVSLLRVNPNGTIQLYVYSDASNVLRLNTMVSYPANPTYD